MSNRVYLFFPPCGQNLRPTSATISTHTSASNAVASQSSGCRSVRNRSTLSPPHPSSPHRTLKVSENDSHWQPPAAHSDERPRPQKYSCAQRCLNALAPGYLKGTVGRGHPMVWSLALCPDDANQDPMVYGA